MVFGLMHRKAKSNSAAASSSSSSLSSLSSAGLVCTPVKSSPSSFVKVSPSRSRLRVSPSSSSIDVSPLGSYVKVSDSNSSPTATPSTASDEQLLAEYAEFEMPGWIHYSDEELEDKEYEYASAKQVPSCLMEGHVPGRVDVIAETLHSRKAGASSFRASKLKTAMEKVKDKQDTIRVEVLFDAEDPDSHSTRVLDQTLEDDDIQGDILVDLDSVLTDLDTQMHNLTDQKRISAANLRIEAAHQAQADMNKKMRLFAGASSGLNVIQKSAQVADLGFMDTEIKYISRAPLRRVIDFETPNSVDVQKWTPKLRDIVIEAANKKAERRMSIGQILEQKCGPKVLSLNSGRLHPVETLSTLMARRIQKWHADHAEEVKTAQLGRPGVDFLPGIEHLTNPIVRPALLEHHLYKSVQGPVDTSDCVDQTSEGDDDILEMADSYLDPDMLSEYDEDSLFTKITDYIFIVTFFDGDAQPEVGHYTMDQLIEGSRSVTLSSPDTKREHGCYSGKQFHEIDNSASCRQSIEKSMKEIAVEPEWPQELHCGVVSQRPSLMINTNLETIIEEGSDTPFSSTSKSSNEFEGRRAFVWPLETSKSDCLDHTSPVEPTSPSDICYFFDELFKDATWWCEPNLYFALPGSAAYSYQQPLGEEMTSSLKLNNIAMAFSVKGEPVQTLGVTTADTERLFVDWQPDHKVLFARTQQQREQSSSRWHREEQARAEIAVLEIEVSNFVGHVFSRINDDSFRGLQAISEDAIWALEYLSQVSPYSRLVLQLETAIEILLERMAAPNSGRSGHLHPVWLHVWTPNENNDDDDLYSKGRIVLKQLAQRSFPTVDDPYIPFSVHEAQAKFVWWDSEYGCADPGDPDYEMLTHAHMVSMKLLECLTDMTRAIRGFTANYVNNIKTYNVALLLDITRSLIEEDFDPNRPSGLPGISLGEMCSKTQAIYQSLRTCSGTMREEGLGALEKGKVCIEEWLLYLQAYSTRSLQADYTYHSANLFWKTAFLCIREIEDAHEKVMRNGEMQHLEPRMKELKDLIWCDWIGNMCDALSLVELFDGRIHASFLPSEFDFVVDSLRWWEAQVCRKMRTIRSAY